MPKWKMMEACKAGECGDCAESVPAAKPGEGPILCACDCHGRQNEPEPPGGESDTLLW